MVDKKILEKYKDVINACYLNKKIVSMIKKSHMTFKTDEDFKKMICIFICTKKIAQFSCEKIVNDLYQIFKNNRIEINDKESLSIIRKIFRSEYEFTELLRMYCEICDINMNLFNLSMDLYFHSIAIEFQYFDNIEDVLIYYGIDPEDYYDGSEIEKLLNLYFNYNFD